MPHVLNAMRLMLAAGGVLFAAFAVDRGDAQPAASDALCRLSENQTSKAIAAFDKLMPVFQNDRCANCHHKIDPFAAKGHLDIKEALKIYRDKRVLAAAKRSDSPAEVDRTHAAILNFLNTGSASETQRVSIMFGNACSVCHDPPPGEPNWRMAPTSDSFHDKDRLTLCKHIHKNSLTKPAAAFDKHMATDEFIKVGFDGSRGLNGLGEASFESSTNTKYSKKPLRPATHASMMASVREWIDLQGGEYAVDLDCGCKPVHYALQLDQVWEGSLTGDVRYTTRGQSGGKIPLTFHDDGTFSGETAIALTMTHEGAGGAVNCKWVNTTDIVWKVRGTLPESGPIDIIGVQEVSPRAVSMTCTMPGGPRTFSQPARGARSEPVSAQIPARLGGRATIEKTWPMPAIKDTTILTLVKDER